MSDAARRRPNLRGGRPHGSSKDHRASHLLPPSRCGTIHIGFGVQPHDRGSLLLQRSISGIVRYARNTNFFSFLHPAGHHRRNRGNWTYQSYIIIKHSPSLPCFVVFPAFPPRLCTAAIDFSKVRDRYHQSVSGRFISLLVRLTESPDTMPFTFSG